MKITLKQGKTEGNKKKMNRRGLDPNLDFVTRVARALLILFKITV